MINNGAGCLYVSEHVCMYVCMLPVNLATLRYTLMYNTYSESAWS